MSGRDERLRPSQRPLIGPLWSEDARPELTTRRRIVEPTAARVAELCPLCGRVTYLGLSPAGLCVRCARVVR